MAQGERALQVVVLGDEAAGLLLKGPKVILRFLGSLCLG